MKVAQSVFLSYSGADRTVLLHLRAALAELEAEGTIRLWSDLLMDAGSAWEETIHSRLRTAEIVLFLLSARLPAGHYLLQVELPMALDRARSGEGVLVPIVVDDYARALLAPDGTIDHPARTLAAYQGLPVRGSLEALGDEGYAQVVAGVRRLAVRRQVEALSSEIRRAAFDELPIEVLAAGIQRHLGVVPGIEEVLSERGVAGGETSPEAHATLAYAALAVGAESSPYIARHLVAHALRSEDETLQAAVADVLVKTSFVVAWLREVGHRDRISAELHAFSSGLRDSVTRDRLDELHRFLAESGMALDPRPLDARGLLAAWRERRGLALDPRERDAAHLPDPTAPQPPSLRTPFTIRFGNLATLPALGQVLATGGYSVLRYASSPPRLLGITNPSASFSSVFPAPDGRRYLCVVSSQGQLRDARTDAWLYQIELGGTPTCVSWASDSRAFTVLRDETLTRYSADTGAVLGRVEEEALDNLQHTEVAGHLVCLAREGGQPGVRVYRAEGLVAVGTFRPLPAGVLVYSSAIVAVPSRGVAVILGEGVVAACTPHKNTLSSELHMLKAWAGSLPPFVNGAALSADEGRIWWAVTGGRVACVDTTSLRVTHVSPPVRGMQPDAELEGFVAVDLDEWIWLKQGEAIMRVATTALLGSGRPRAECVDKASHPGEPAVWITDAEGRVAFSAKGTRGLRCRDLATFAEWGLPSSKSIEKWVATPAPDGSVTVVALDHAGTLYLWSTRSEWLLATTHIHKEIKGLRDVMAMDCDGRHVYMLGQGHDDQRTYAIIVGVTAHGFGAMWHADFFGVDDLRKVRAAHASRGHLLVSSAKRLGCLTVWRDALAFVRAVSEPISGGRNLYPGPSLSPIRRGGPADGWTNALTWDGLVYLWNIRSLEIAVVALDDPSPDLRVLCHGVHVTNWHVSGRYLVVASNHQMAVYLVDRFDGLVTPVTTDLDIAFAAAWGPDAQSIEVFSVVETAPVRRLRRERSAIVGGAT
jgi:hypothetical protein